MTIPWYHAAANLPNTLEIIQEFQNTLSILYPEFDIETSRSTYKQTPHDVAKEHLLKLSESLKQVGLYDSWTSTSFIVTHAGAVYRPHIDKPATATTPGRIFSLNIPIFNCDKSVTSFYKLPGKVDERVVHVIPNVGERQAFFTDMSDVILELVDRTVLTEPRWLRVDVPHGVRCTGPETRLVAALRFTPEPFDYLLVNPDNFD